MQFESKAAALKQMKAAPRNYWTKLRAVLYFCSIGDVRAAEATLEGLRHHPELTPDILAIYETHVRQARGAGDQLPRINTPSDYLSSRHPALRQPYRHLRANARHPKPFPIDLALPGLIGVRNNHHFIEEAATALAPYVTDQQPRVQVVWTPAGIPDDEIATQTSALLGDLAGQSYGGPLNLTLLKHSSTAGLTLPNGQVTALSATLSEPQTKRWLEEIAQDCDVLVFLGGEVSLDETAIERALFLTRVSDTIVQPLVAASAHVALESPFTTSSLKKTFTGRFPFRDVQGFNMVVPAALLRRVGGTEPRFQSSFRAAGELAFRMFNSGAYFAPLHVPRLDRFRDDQEAFGDALLFEDLCPNHWDRKADGYFEVPKVSVYVPLYNAGKYIERAIDSVLAQDVDDLEICLSDDGSHDNTLQILRARYSNEAKVRWVANANGGIGFASNQAITMSKGIYIGQLDSDDCLKPGAVRRLMEYLDEHPEVACCYGSCERIDADGNYLQDEYSWPVFSREKMMLTSIAHHFRMFRRSAWERTSRFREDIVNAVDYDIFLKLSEVGPFHHIDEMMYQRRWHGENTSNVNEGHQTTNTYRVQREALKRLGLDRFWDVHVPDPNEPRRVTYKRDETRPMVFYWPDYSRSNPYPKMLYGQASQEIQICIGDIDAALRVARETSRPDQIVFHLHWINFLFRDVTSTPEAQDAVDAFLAKLESFQALGGKLVWTLHNTVSHNTPYHDLEVSASTRIADMADCLHVHSQASVAEITEVFPLPEDKIAVSRHGNYIGVYPDFVTREAARRYLEIDPQDEVILFTGQVRPYKGVEQLVSVFRDLLKDHPKALLLIAGDMKFDLQSAFDTALSAQEQARIRISDRFVDDMELQLFFRAADMAVYPYQKILTSGSMLLALSFGVPVVIPEVGMTREVLEGQEAGMLYDGDAGPEALDAALRRMLAVGPDGLAKMGRNARTLAERLDWPDFGVVLGQVACKDTNNE